MKILFHPSFNGNYPVKVGLPVCNSIEKSSSSNFLSLKSERSLSTPNTGNLVHLEAPSRMFDFNIQKSTRSNLFDLLNVFKGNASDLKKFIEENFDAVVISEANFITPTEASNKRCHTLAKILENLNVKLFLFGAGMQRPLPSQLEAAGKGVSKLLQVLNEQATLFCVRGHETEKWLHQCGIEKAIALGCPSFYIYPQKIVDIKPSESWDKETMLLSAGYLQNKRRTRVLSEAIKDTRCNYVFQNDLFSILDDFNDIKGCYDQATGKLSKSIINQAVESLIGLFPPFKDYFIFQDTRSWRQFCAWHNLYFGDRLHGGVIAMQAGVPGIFIYDDLRVKELIDFFQLPGYSVNQIKEKTVQQLYLDQLNSGAWEDFIVAYKTRLKVFVETCQNVGLAFRHQGDIHQALQNGNEGDADQVFQINQDNAQFHYGISCLLAQQNRLSEAIESAQRAIERQPEQVNWYQHLGDLLTKQGQWSEAEKVYRKGIKLTPTAANLYHALSDVLDRQGHIEEAIASARQAVELKPKQASLYKHLGDLLAKSDQLPEAEKAYREAVELSPTDPNLHHILSGIFNRQGRIEEAIASAKRALHFQPNESNLEKHLEILLKKQNRS